MQEVFENIINKLEEQKAYYKDIRKNTHCRVTETSECDSCRADHYLDARLETINSAIEIVKQEAEKYNNGWIPCSERLPKYGEVVMCSCTNSGITISCITHKGVKPSKSVRFGQHSVIAWQPLPQPYTKGE